MTVALRVRGDIDLDAFRRVAWEREDVRIDDDALKTIRRCRDGFLGLIDNDPDVVIYGVTTGYGQRASQRLSGEVRQRHALTPPRAPRVGFGAPLPERTTRGIVLARLSSFLEGHAAVSPELAKSVASMLDGRSLPRIASVGQGGAGEIVALSELFAPLAERAALGEKEALALINGSPVSAALLADAVLAARRRLELAEQVFALSIEALQAPLEAYDPALDALWDDPDEAVALRNLRALLAEPSQPRRPYQAPVSWRILPRILGQTHRALRHAEEAAVISLRAVGDNPIYVPPDDRHPWGRVLSNGSYHNARAYPALDAMTASYADLALLADRHVTKLLDGRVSLLPDQLLVDDGYMGCLGFTAAGFAEQARRAAGATLLPGSEGGGFGQNDVAVPVFHAWRRHWEAAGCLEAALAVLSAICGQAYYVTERSPGPALEGLLGDIRRHVPPVRGMRALGHEVSSLAGDFAERTAPGT